MLTHPVWILMTWLCFLIGTSAACILFLRQIRTPGGRPAHTLIGGCLAGVLLGPMVLGQLQPAFYTSIFLGGQKEQLALLAFEESQQLQKQALENAGVSEQALIELTQQQDQKKQQLQNQLNHARQLHKKPISIALITLVSIAAGLGALTNRLKVFSPRTESSRRLFGMKAVEIESVLLAAAGTVLISALTTAVFCRWLLGLPPAHGLLIGAAVASGSIFASLPMRWTPRAGRLNATQLFGLLCAVGAILIALIAGLVLTKSNQYATSITTKGALWLMFPVAAASVGLIISTLRPLARKERSLIRIVLIWLVLPTIVASAMSLADPRMILSSWRTMLFALISVLGAGSGHFTGAWLAWQITMPDADRSTLATRQWVECHAAGFALTQACWLGVLFASEAVDPISPTGSALVIVLTLNMMTTELFLGFQRRVASAMLGFDESD